MLSNKQFLTWMLRRSRNGKAFGGFQWNPIGQWTEAPDWKPVRKCGNGLHGNDGYSTGAGVRFQNLDVDFCIYDPSDMIRINQNEIKVKRAMVLLRNRLPTGLKFSGDLDLSYSNIIELPDGLEVAGSLRLDNTNISKLPNDLVVTGVLTISNSNITELPAGLKVESLDLFNSKVSKMAEFSGLIIEEELEELEELDPRNTIIYRCDHHLTILEIELIVRQSPRSVNHL